MRKRSFFLLPFIFFLSSVFFYGCGGGGPGSPGSCGTENTGVILVASPITPTYKNSNTNSVDAVQDVCNEGPPIEYEYFADHGANITITARLVNPDTTFQPGHLYIEKYTIKYFRKTDSIGAPPIEMYVGTTAIDITPPTGTGTTTLTTSVVFLDLKRKIQYYDDILSGRFTPNLLNNYTVVYKFEGENDLGEKFCFEATGEFEIADFDNCS